VEDYGMKEHDEVPKEDPEMRHFTGEIVANIRRWIN
jgi:hypothetical protein